MILITTNSNKTFTVSDGRLNFTNADHLVALGQLFLKSEYTATARTQINVADHPRYGKAFILNGSPWGIVTNNEAANMRTLGGIVALNFPALRIIIQTDFDDVTAANTPV